MKLKNNILYLLLLIFIGLGLASCSLLPKNNKLYINSFGYNVIENESSVSNELSYSLSFEMGFKLPKRPASREIIIAVKGKKSFRVSIDYCNTENITLSAATDKYPSVLLKYVISNEADSIEATVKLKISTSELMDDVNNFLTIQCFNEAESEFIDEHQLRDEEGYFKLNYSSDTGIFYEYNEFSESYKVVSVITKSKTLEIPASRDGHPVREIEAGAFDAVPHVEELILPTSLTSFTKGILSKMTNLKTLTIPFVGQNSAGNRNTSFGFLFAKEDEMVNVSIPESLKEVIIAGGSLIDIYAFANCETLETIIIEDNVKTSIGNMAFLDCKALENITIGNQTESIRTTSFLGCDSITHATIPSFAIPFIPKVSLEEVLITDGESIEDHVFLNSEKLETVVIYDGITSIGSSAFSGCNSLTTITLPSDLSSVKESAFYDCTAIEEVYYSGSIKDWCSILFESENSNPMKYGSQFYIRKDNDWEEVTEIEIPDSFTNIGEWQFYGFDHLTTISIPNSIESVGEAAFKNCNSLVKAMLPLVALSSIPKNKLKELVITLGDRIEGNAFANCSNLEKITLPDTIKTIGESAFANCSSLPSITIPPNVISIGDQAFSWCSSLKSITIPVSVTDIGQYAVYNCNELSDVYYEGDLSDWCNINFNSMESNPMRYADHFYLKEDQDWKEVKELVIPKTITTIGKWQFYGFSSITSVLIPKEIKSIEENAFSECNNLKEIYYLGSAASWENISINPENSDLALENIYFYSMNTPYDNDNYWHYVNDEITKW